MRQSICSRRTWYTPILLETYIYGGRHHDWTCSYPSAHPGITFRNTYLRSPRMPSSALERSQARHNSVPSSTDGIFVLIGRQSNG